jgi:hypothetical protein
MDKARQEEIIKALQEKHATGSCPRCSNLQFDIVGETVLPMTMEPWVIGGVQTGLPLVLVACSNCGYIAQHATAILGLKR